MINKIFILFFLIFSFKIYSQTDVYDAYPPGQEAYVGGEIQLNKDLHKIMIEKKLEPCEDVKQIYTADLIVKSDSTIIMIKNQDSIYIKKNKCAYDLAKKTLPYIDKWVPAKHNGNNLNAIYRFDFIPDDIYYENTPAEFPNGIGEFRNKFMQNFNSQNIDGYLGKYSFDINFTVNEFGLIENIDVVSNRRDKKLVKMIESALKNVKEKWTPAKVHGVFVESKMRLPFIFHFE
jgi:hypothetical protein